MITHTPTGVPLLGVTGFKNTGKTTLVARLVAQLTADGYRVSTIKHAHHTAEVDQPGTDSMSHREAGAAQVLLVTPKRLALMEEFHSTEPPFEEIIGLLGPADLVVVEGYKSLPIRKLLLTDDRMPAPVDPASVIAQISAVTDNLSDPLPCFHRDDIAAIARFVIDTCQLAAPAQGEQQHGT